MDNPKAVKRVWFTAQDLGSEAEMDAQGRVLFSPELRRELDIENQPVKVLVVNGAIQVMSEEMFKTQQAEAAAVVRGRCGNPATGWAQVMPYALCRDGGRSDRLAGGPARGHVSGCHGRTGGPYGGDRAALDHGQSDRQRPRRGVARNGAAQHGRMGRSDLLSPGDLLPGLPRRCRPAERSR